MLQRHGVAYVEEFAELGGRDTGIGGEAIEVVEAEARRPCRERGFALESETLLEAVESDAGEGITGRDGATGAGIATFEGDFADGETDDAAFVFAE